MKEIAKPVVSICALLIATVLCLAGCSPSAKIEDFPILPDDLKDCKFYRLTDGDGSAITVARCPGSNTTVQQSDKAHTTSVVIDGQEYTKK
jgi:hypothetical protein